MEKLITGRLRGSYPEDALRGVLGVCPNQGTGLSRFIPVIFFNFFRSDVSTHEHTGSSLQSGSLPLGQKD
jgi:hypothetical protein